MNFRGVRTKTVCAWIATFLVGLLPIAMIFGIVDLTWIPTLIILSMLVGMLFGWLWVFLAKVVFRVVDGRGGDPFGGKW